MCYPTGHYFIEACDFVDPDKNKFGRHWHSEYLYQGHPTCSSLSKVNEGIGVALGQNNWFMVRPPLPEIIHLHLHKPSTAYYNKKKTNKWEPRFRGGSYCGKDNPRCVQVRVVPVQPHDMDLFREPEDRWHKV